VMLSEETAIGKFPVRVVEMMARVCRTAEKDLVFAPEPLGSRTHQSVRDGIAHAACLLARDINASVIICVTDSGATAKHISRYNPSNPVLACTTSVNVARELAMYPGVIPVIVDEQMSIEKLLDRAVARGKERELVKSGDRIVFTGNLTGTIGETNLLSSVMV
ncbi:MAG TPA: pyruvate kinase, partial [Firmicutes bacterium]|nr:pyruvate kinase [Bacillota bacterium]